jgi:hypothetical protein
MKKKREMTTFKNKELDADLREMCKNFNTLQLKNPESESGQKNKGRYI